MMPTGTTIEFDGALNPAREDVGPPAAGGRGYLGTPDSGSGPGILLLHAWWGLNDTVRGWADQLAESGYTVLAPDMFGGQVASTIEQAEAQAQGVEGDEAALVRLEQIVLGAADWLVAKAGAPIGAIGFSFGAGYAVWLARKRVDEVGALVLFYGTGGGLGDGRAPLMGHYAGEDPFEPAAGVDAFEAELRDAGRLAGFHRYPGQAHWFAEPDRPEYDQAAAQLAWQRTLEFLSARLREEQ